MERLYPREESEHIDDLLYNELNVHYKKKKVM